MTNKLRLNPSKTKKIEKDTNVNQNKYLHIAKVAIIYRLSRKKRAVSEIITTLMLLSITVIGAVFLSTFFQDTDITDVSASVTAKTSSANAPSMIKLIGYDTRDGPNLFVIGVLDNDSTLIGGARKLCTLTCANTKDEKPANGAGTEFIILHIRNDDVNFVYIQNVIINDVIHTWDIDSQGKPFNPDTGAKGINFPLAGTFSIIEPTGTSSLNQASTNSLDGGKEIRLVVKLKESGFSDDIQIGSALKVLVDTDRFDPGPFIIPSGRTR